MKVNEQKVFCIQQNQLCDLTILNTVLCELISKLDAISDSNENLKENLDKLKPICKRRRAGLFDITRDPTQLFKQDLEMRKNKEK